MLRTREGIGWRTVFAREINLSGRPRANPTPVELVAT